MVSSISVSVSILTRVQRSREALVTILRWLQEDPNGRISWLANQLPETESSGGVTDRSPPTQAALPSCSSYNPHQSDVTNGQLNRPTGRLPSSNKPTNSTLPDLGLGLFPSNNSTTSPSCASSNELTTLSGPTSTSSINPKSRTNHPTSHNLDRSLPPSNTFTRAHPRLLPSKPFPWKSCYISKNEISFEESTNPSIVLKIPEGQGLTQQDIRLLNTEIIKNFKITPSSEIFEALSDADNANLGIHLGGFKSDSLTSLHSKHSRARSRSHIGTRLLCLVKFNIVNHEMKRLGYDTKTFRSRKNRVVESLLDPSWDKGWKSAFYEDVKLGMKLSALPRGSSLGLWNFSRNQRLARLSQSALYILAAWIRNYTDWADLEDVEHSICLQVNPAQTKRLPVPWVDEGHTKRAADQLLPAHAQKRLRQVEGTAVQNSKTPSKQEYT